MANESTRNWRSIALWASTGIIALFFAWATVTKLAGADMWPEYFARWGLPMRFMYLTGIVEAIGAVALLIPRVSGLGALFLATEVVVGVGVHRTNAEFIPDSIPAIVLVLLLAFIAYSRRDAITWALAQNKDERRRIALARSTDRSSRARRSTTASGTPVVSEGQV